MKKQNVHIPLNNLLLLSYIAILSIVLIIGVSLYNISSKQVKSGINEQNRLALSSSVDQLDSMLEVMGAAARQISSNSTFNALISMEGGDDPSFYYIGYQTQITLTSFTPVERLLPIKSSFIYMKNSDYVISPTLFSRFFSYAWHNSRGLLSEESFPDNFLNPVFWNRFSWFQNQKDFSQNIFYMYPLSASVPATTTAQAVLIYEFDSNLLSDYFSDMNFFDDGYVIAYDKGGSAAFLLADPGPTSSSFEETAGETAENEKDGQKSYLNVSSYEELQNLNYENQIARFTPEGGTTEMLVTTAVSNYNGWTYYLVQPAEKAYYFTTSYQRFFTLITIVAFIVGGIIAAVFAILSGMKMDKLSNELTATETLNTSLNQLVESQKPMVNESYMRRIMEGSITTNEEMQRIIAELSLDRPDIKYHVLYTEISPSEDSSVHSSDMELCMQNYDMLVREALHRYYPDTGYIYKPSDRAFAILIASDQHTAFESIIKANKSTFINLHNELLDRYGIWISGGFGDRNGVISYTWKSYQQAREAKMLTTLENYILSNSDFAHSSDVYYYPQSLSVQLSGFISTGNKDQVSELFKLIITENTLKRNLSYTQLHWLISDIRGTVFKKRHNIIAENLTPEKTKILDLVDRQFQGEMSLNALKTISLELCDIYGGATESNDLILKIQEYINSNYHDPELGLTKISSEFGISENYFSYLFKKEVSENFSTYLERLRMAKAKEMVLESNASLSTLYQYLGYSNAASFRRAFKKNFGVSPKEMRDNVNAKS